MSDKTGMAGMNETTHDQGGSAAAPTSTMLVVLAWLIVLIPLGFGLWQTVVKAGLLLGGG